MVEIEGIKYVTESSVENAMKIAMLIFIGNNLMYFTLFKIISINISITLFIICLFAFVGDYTIKIRNKKRKSVVN